MTVGELRELLADLPELMPVTVLVTKVADPFEGDPMTGRVTTIASALRDRSEVLLRTQGGMFWSGTEDDEP